MDNENYKQFNNCKEGYYNNAIRLHDKHTIFSDCIWCQSRFSSSIQHIEKLKYFSVLFRVGYTAGGNWGDMGYNSLNMIDNKIMQIPSSILVKNKLIQEIRDYLTLNPIEPIEYKKYCHQEPLLYEEINKWEINDLTFYFKSDVLHIIYSNGGYGPCHIIADIPLPKLQSFLKL
jgi:hypothetical protein